VKAWLQSQIKECFERRRKARVIRQIENGGGGGRGIAEGYRKFGLVNSTVQWICKNRTKVISAFERNKLTIKRL
jgi:hypothetical protein